MGKKYYAVRKGLNIGIYETWEECEKQVIGYKGAIFKSFPTRKEAEKFVSGDWEYHPSERTLKKREIKAEIAARKTKELGKKYYAVRKGLNIGIYETWEECKKQVIGYKGAVFKSFPTRREAEKFVSGDWEYHPSERTLKKREVKAEMAARKAKELDSMPKNPPLTGTISFKRKASSPPPSSLSDELDILTDKLETYKENETNKAIAYVDGSYNIHTKEYSYGAVIFHKGKEYRFKQKFDNLTLKTMRNVAGEIEGSKKAISFCVENDIKHLDLYYDYEGIAKWARGEWRTNKPGTIAYKNYYDDIVRKHQLKVKFIKVKAHSNNKYNDLADQLAKEALFGHSFHSISNNNASTNTYKRIKFSN